MSAIAAISFPKKLKTPRLSDIINKKIAFDIDYVVDIFQEEICRYSKSPIKVNDVIFSDIEDRSMNIYFNNCFKNSFIYDICITKSKYKYDEKMKIAMENEEIEIIRRKLKNIWDKERLLSDQLLYTFLQLTLNVGEFVEIYSDWIYGENYNFGPPESEDVMDLEELLIFPKPEEPERTMEKHKLTIYKTKQRDLPLL
ncbi:MAG: hypothetical protein FWC91_14370 [Defluviitaleaceae bacterium]|nr:hypothetical protein [Defluviitaleaceae bacterium]